MTDTLDDLINELPLYYRLRVRLRSWLLIRWYRFVGRLRQA